MKIVIIKKLLKLMYLNRTLFKLHMRIYPISYAHISHKIHFPLYYGYYLPALQSYNVHTFN